MCAELTVYYFLSLLSLLALRCPVEVQVRSILFLADSLHQGLSEFTHLPEALQWLVAEQRWHPPAAGSCGPLSISAHC